MVQFTIIHLLSVTSTHHLTFSCSNSSPNTVLVHQNTRGYLSPFSYRDLFCYSITTTFLLLVLFLFVCVVGAVPIIQVDICDSCDETPVCTLFIAKYKGDNQSYTLVAGEWKGWLCSELKCWLGPRFSLVYQFYRFSLNCSVQCQLWLIGFWIIDVLLY